MGTAIIYADSSARLDLQLPWALRIAAARGDELQILIRGEAKQAEGPTAVDLTADGIGREIAAELDEHLGAWRVPEPPAEEAEPKEEAEQPEEALPPSVSAFLLPMAGGIGELVLHLREVKPVLLVATRQTVEGEDAESSSRRRHLLRRVSCEIVLIRTGNQATTSNTVMVPCARGPHCAAALRLADAMTPDDECFFALVVEPAIGTDAQYVGRRILDRILSHALDERATRVTPLVRVHDSVHVGIREAADAGEVGLILMGTSKLGAIGQRLRGTIGQRLLKSDDSLTIAFVRAAIPIRGRVQRQVEAWLQTSVPQLERDARIGLFERVQSNSAWDFDFLALMALSTVIASAGLIENSAAVIIGAMLVAPLMTPLLGMGLAMVQGNPRLLRLASRTVLLGFLTTLGIGFLSGFAVPRFQLPTPEMVARDWPLLIDLVIAFAAGLAGAYTFAPQPDRRTPGRRDRSRAGPAHRDGRFGALARRLRPRGRRDPAVPRQRSRHRAGDDLRALGRRHPRRDGRQPYDEARCRWLHRTAQRHQSLLDRLPPQIHLAGRSHRRGARAPRRTTRRRPASRRRLLAPRSRWTRAPDPRRGNAAARSSDRRRAARNGAGGTRRCGPAGADRQPLGVGSDGLSGRERSSALTP